MKPLDTRPLSEAIRNLAVDLHAQGITSPAEFAAEFHIKYPALCDEFAQYGFDYYLTHTGKAVMKKVGREIADAGNDTLILPGFDLPQTLPVNRENDGQKERVWVPLTEGTIEDGDEYLKSLKANVEACRQSLADWADFWAKARPLLEANQGWRIGEAIDHLAADQN